MLIYKFYNGRPYIKLANRKVPGIAQAMHSKMYAAFAEYVPRPIRLFDFRKVRCIPCFKLG